MIQSTEFSFNIKDLGKMGYAGSSIDEIAEFFNMNFLSGEELAFARVQEGVKHIISQNDSLIKEGVIYNSKWKNKIILTRESFILEDLKRALEDWKRALLEDPKSVKPVMNVLRNRSEYFTSEKELAEFVERIEGKGGLVLALNNFEPISTYSKYDDRAFWLFGESTEDYFNLLHQNGTMEIPLKFDNEAHIQRQRIPYANQLRIFNVNNSSQIYGNMPLGYMDKAFGKLFGKLSSDNDHEKNNETTSKPVSNRGSNKHKTDINGIKLITQINGS